MAEDGPIRAIPRRFEDAAYERYAGEMVLEDWTRLPSLAPVDARLVMIRFLAAQYFTNRLRGDWAGPLLRLQRSAALNAIGTGLVLDRELRLLRRALELDVPEGGWQGAVISGLAQLAELASARGHLAGAEALDRIAYEAALRERLFPVAAAAADRLAALLPESDADGRRRWRRRARTLARRTRGA
jgi:hypothetical protein